MTKNNRVSKKDGKKADKPKPFDRCYICERFVGSTAERDHFPKSHAEGGLEILNICEPCHTLKDRIPFDNWEPEVAFNALKGLWNKCDTEERLWMAKIFHILSMQASFIDEVKIDTVPPM
jgi:hypothetical protein